MRTGTSRRVRTSHPGAELMPLMKKVTPQKLRSPPRATRATRARARLLLGPRRSPSRGRAASAWRRGRSLGSAEGAGQRFHADADSDGTLSIVDGIRGIDCADNGAKQRRIPFGARRLGPCDGTEGLLLLSVIAEAQESSKSRKRVKLPDVPARRCGYCGARSTVQWRSGPKEVPILCNACGVKYRKGKLQPKDMADQMLEIDDLENGPAPGMLHLVDQTSGNSNSSAALSARQFQAGQLHPRTPRCSSSSTAGVWPFSNGPEGALQGSPGTNPAPWGFVPQMIAPNQPRPVTLQPQFGQMVSCMNDCLPMLPMPSLVHAEDEGLQEMNSWDHMGGYTGWHSHSSWGLRLGSFDGPMEKGENEGASRVGCTAGLQEAVAKSSPRNLDFDNQAKCTMKDTGEVTLRWLAKRKRTGPKPEV